MSHRDIGKSTQQRIDALGVAGIIEFGDVPPAVGEQLRDAQGAGNDLEPARTPVPFGLDFLIARKAQSRCDPLECDQHIELARLGDLRTRLPPNARACFKR
jgi:hypothetical protein